MVVGRPRSDNTAEMSFKCVHAYYTASVASTNLPNTRPKNKNPRPGCPWTGKFLRRIISELQVFYFNPAQRAVPAA